MKDLNCTCQLLFNVSIKNRIYCVHCTPLCGSIACLSGTHRWLIQIFRPFQNGVIQSTEYNCNNYNELEKHVFYMCKCQFEIDYIQDRDLILKQCS